MIVQSGKFSANTARLTASWASDIVADSQKRRLNFVIAEIVTVRGSQIIKVEVYFGWDLPHKAQAGGFVDKA